MAEVPSDTPKRRPADGDDVCPPQSDSHQHEDEEVDEASEESFPASDAPGSWSGPPGS